MRGFTSLSSLLLALASATLVPQVAKADFVNNGTLGTYDCAVGSPSTANSSSQVTFVSSTNLASCPEALVPVYPFNRINLRSPDDSIRASFMPHGATMIDFWVKDRQGIWRDIIAGYENVTNEKYDPIHPYFGPQVGRYANRIKNGTFVMDGQTYNIPKNENNLDTLHGANGFDNRSYTVEHLNASSVLFKLYDKAGSQGFPGAVVAVAEYTLSNKGQFQIRMDADVVQGKSPVMLSHHVYWALHGYSSPNDDDNTILNHTLHMPKANKYIKTDSILIPTGPIPSVQDTPYDFQTPRKFSERFNDTLGVCGAGCTGWDSCFVMDKHERHKTILTLTSPETGIQMKVKTNQDAIQIYTCSGVSGAKGAIPRKRSQGGDGTLDKVYDNYSCVVIEMEDYIDGINNPQWGRNQFYDQGRPYKWRAEYSFSTVD